ncbi:MAG: ADP-ribosylglycohydrolase family protein [Actinomycetota bacterium]
MYDEMGRVHGCLAGLAVGDAMGRPTELLLNYRRIERRYGRVTGLVGRDAGMVTDDTRLTLTVADAILANGGIVDADGLIDSWKDNPEFAWRKFLRSFNRRDGFWIGEHIVAWAGRLGLPGHLAGLLNPSWLAAGNEAAMIMAPVGILFRGRPEEAMRAGRDLGRACITGPALDVAGMWAACIAEALACGATVGSVLEAAVSFSTDRVRGYVDRALALSKGYSDPYSARAELYRCCLQPVFIDARETVPIALSMFAIAEGDPMTAILGGANFGRDSDTIAGMAGLLSGALAGFGAIDVGAYAKVTRANDFDLGRYAERLLAIGSAPEVAQGE